MPKILEEESPEWWRAAARRLPVGSAGRVYCRVVATALEGRGTVRLSWDECASMSLDDAIHTAASTRAYEVMDEEE